MEDGENINKKILEDLKNLRKVEAPKNFETELWRKINSSEGEKKESIWERIFSPSKIAPAAVAIVSAVIIFFVVDVNSEEMEDPLNIEPRLREDLIVYEGSDKVSVKNEINSEIRIKESDKSNKGRLEQTDNTKQSRSLSEIEEEKFINEVSKDQGQKLIADELSSNEQKSDTNLSEESRNLGGSVSPSVITTNSNEINRSNLNFMQRTLTLEEKDEVQQLKMKVESQKSAKTDENQTKSPQK